MDSSIDDAAMHAETSWRDIFLTIFVASAAAYFFFHRQNPNSSNSSHPLSSSNLNDDERLKRRERMAAIAEERAAAMRRAQQQQNIDSNLSVAREVSTSEFNNDGAPKVHPGAPTNNIAAETAEKSSLNVRMIPTYRKKTLVPKRRRRQEKDMKRQLQRY